MTIEQTVEIPASRRLTIDVPREIPAGQVVLAFTPVGEMRKEPAFTGEPGDTPRFSRDQIEAWSHSPDLQALAGALKGLPEGLSIKDIREQRRAEQYGL